MAGTHIHIVSLDVPWPPDYGGVIDVFHKVKALHGIGVHVHLHCFEYGRGKQKELDRYCTSVQYYKRQMGKLQLLSSLPYVVVSRRSDELVDRLLKDDHPILFEGLHSCYHLGDPRLHGRKRLVRAHNVEHDYYSALAKVESSPFKRSYFNSEAAKLKRYEPVLSEADAVLAISPKDAAYFNQHFRNVVHVPAFHACEKVDVPDGLGDFALYHGALGVADNNKAALWLLREVFNGINVKLVIAGSDASSELKAEVAKHPNAELLEDISTERIHELVRTAQVHVLPTFQATGIKLKLLLCLFMGRHVVCNSPMVEGTGLEDLCHIHDDPASMRLSIQGCMARPANGSTLEKRAVILEERFSNERNAQRIVDLLQPQRTEREG
ncbi:MAG: glycosyltransferase [Flavobacteriales bacterium]|nr:glycosyltransferase [Flavobacteriales bacterium]